MKMLTILWSKVILIMWVAAELLTLLALLSPSLEIQKNLFFLFGEKRLFYLFDGYLLTAILALYYLVLLVGKQKDSGMTGIFFYSVVC